MASQSQYKPLAMPSQEEIDYFMNTKRPLLLQFVKEKAAQLERARETGDLTLVSEEEAAKAGNVAAKWAESKVCQVWVRGSFIVSGCLSLIIVECSAPSSAHFFFLQ